MRPVLARVVADHRAMVGRPLTLLDFAEMNDALDVQAENDARLRRALEQHG